VRDHIEHLFVVQAAVSALTIDPRHVAQGSAATSGPTREFNGDDVAFRAFTVRGRTIRIL
ncbi:MAG: hypothetical protein WAW51_05820, partial [Ilumatobacteraceae bacterium]